MGGREIVVDAWTQRIGRWDVDFDVIADMRLRRDGGDVRPHDFDVDYDRRRVVIRSGARTARVAQLVAAATEEFMRRQQAQLVGDVS